MFHQNDIIAAHTRQIQSEATDKALSKLPGKRFYIESYGCQMNLSDSEIVAAILAEADFVYSPSFEHADLILVNTCSIREKAEQTVRKRLKIFQKVKKQRSGTLIGVLGCMAERLKKKLLEEEKMVDLVIGPDAYRDLPKLISEAENGREAVNVFLSREETYANISPVRLKSNGVTAFISIMRGCDNMCSFCVVPYTRGRERSRNPESIVQEAKALFENGFSEVTLLGQNVDSYCWKENGIKTNFAQLLAYVAGINSQLRIRFSTSHPKDITDEVLLTMKNYSNICQYIHLPVQSGSSRILKLMNRTYDREWYLDKIKRIREILPNAGISTDIMTGFCTETEAEHAETLSLMETVKFDMAYMFAYSERPNTPAEKQLKDDVPSDVKKQRLNEVIALQQKHSFASNQNDVGKTFRVLVEKTSKKSAEELAGRNDQNKMVVFPKKYYQVGNYVKVKITKATSATLIGEPVDES